MALPSNQKRLDVLFPDARHIIRCTPDAFGEAGRRLAELFSESLARRCRDLTDATPKTVLLHRIDLARLAATLSDYSPDPEMPEASWLDFQCNAPMVDRQEAARLVVLAILLAADPDAGLVITPSMCELVGLGWFDGPGGLLGRGLIDWSEPGWADGNSPSDRVLDRLQDALQLIRAGSIYPNGWAWSQDGSIFFDGTGVPWEAMLPELLQQAERLAELVRSCDPDGTGGRILGSRKGAFDRAFGKMALLAGTIVGKLYIPTRRQDPGQGIAFSELVPLLEYHELADAVKVLATTPFGHFGLEQLQNLTAEQIDRFDRNRGFVADLAGMLPTAEPSASEDSSESESSLRNADPDHQPFKARATAPDGKLRPHLMLAGASLEWVQRVRPDLDDRRSLLKDLRQAQYEHIRDSGECPAYPDGPPDRGSWETYVRKFLRERDGPVRGVKPSTGASIVRAANLPRRDADR